MDDKNEKREINKNIEVKSENENKFQVQSGVVDGVNKALCHF